MNGTPHLQVMRSISLYGLSDVRLTFEEGVDPYFARQLVFQRLSDATLPQGVIASMSPLFSPSGLVYRYVIESPDRTPQELHTYEDWIIERAYRSVPGVADDSGFGGPTMEYHVLLDPVPPLQFSTFPSSKSSTHYRLTTPHWRRFLLPGRPVLLRARTRPGKNHRGHWRNRPSPATTAPRFASRTSATSNRPRPRLGIFGFQDKTKNNDDAVEGVILMRRGEQTQKLLEGVERKTEEINKTNAPARRPVRPLLRPQ